jgi:glycosyltransferase involved in cell wall biosynthesis
MPVVDIVVPFRGDEGFLVETLESVFAQDFKDWKLFLVDNSDSGITSNAITYMMRDSRFVYMRNEFILSLPKNFENARTLGDSPWVIILGADDLLCHNYLSNMVANVETHPNVAFIHPRSRIIDSENHEYLPLTDLVKSLLTPKRFDRQEITFHRLSSLVAIGNFLYFPSIMWNRNYLSKLNFRQDLLITLDLDLELRAVKMSGSYLQLKEYLFKYRRHQQSESYRVESYLSRLEEERDFYLERARGLKPRIDGRLQKFLWSARISNRLNAIVNLYSILKNDRKVAKRLLRIIFYK